MKEAATMKTFTREQIEDIIRSVIELGSNVTVQEKETGNSLSVFEEFSADNKRKVIETFCNGHNGPFQVFAVGSKS
jgi:hypothetical protein